MYIYYNLILSQVSFRDETLEQSVSMVQDIVRTIRHMKQDYLPPKSKPEGIKLY